MEIKRSQIGKKASSPGSTGLSLKVSSPTASSSSKKVHSRLSSQSGKRISMKQVSSRARNSCRFLLLVRSPSMQLSDPPSSCEVSLLQRPGERAGEQNSACRRPWSTQETTSMAGWLCSLMVSPAGRKQKVIRRPFFSSKFLYPMPRPSSFSGLTSRSCSRTPRSAWATPCAYACRSRLSLLLYFCRQRIAALATFTSWLFFIPSQSNLLYARAIIVIGQKLFHPRRCCFPHSSTVFALAERGTSLEKGPFLVADQGWHRCLLVLNVNCFLQRKAQTLEFKSGCFPGEDEVVRRVRRFQLALLRDSSSRHGLSVLY